MYEKQRSVPVVLGLLVVGLSSIAGAGSIDIVAAKAMPLCEKVVKLFDARLTPDADLLRSIQWAPVELKGQGPKTRRCSSLDKALFDVNNDGAQDLVVKTTFCMKGAPSDSLYIFPADSPVLEQASWQDLSPLLATPDKFERTGGTYTAASLPVKEGGDPALSTLFTVHPFVLDGVTYVGMTDGRRQWMVIARYLGGERFDDQCYLRATPS
jgi:hypothetical protein